MPLVGPCSAQLQKKAALHIFRHCLFGLPSSGVVKRPDLRKSHPQANSEEDEGNQYASVEFLDCDHGHPE
jgi:hypothetical protein